MPTLRVFANLIEVPTLVLDDRGRPVEGSTGPKFLVSLDGGKPFLALHSRLEGDDPLALAVLLDANGSQDALLHQLARTLSAQVAPGGLLAHDRVWIYALDCGVVHSLMDEPADAATLKRGVEDVLKLPGLHGPNKHGCENKRALRQVIMDVGQTLSHSPGRRVILAVTGGYEDGAGSSWADVEQAMRLDATTVFGLSGFAVNSMGLVPLPYTREFHNLCETSGGLDLTSNDTNLKDNLTRIFHLLRTRYIVQFPRADDLSEGYHPMRLQVVGRPFYFLRWAGESFPTADPRLKDDPTVLRGSGLKPEPQ